MAEVLEKKMTVQEFREMDFPENDFFIYELINGILMRRTAPKPLHQKISGKAYYAIETFLRQNPIGHAFCAPIDVFFDKYNQTQPDILFIKKEREFIIELEECINGAPDLVVEILSPSSIKTDRFDKKDMYEAFAVKEYWIIDPKNATLEIYNIVENAYKLHQFLEIEGKIQSTILTGFDMDVKDLFD